MREECTFRKKHIYQNICTISNVLFLALRETIIMYMISVPSCGGITEHGHNQLDELAIQ